MPDILFSPKLYEDNHVAYDIPNTIVDFHTSDSEELYKSNLRSQPNDWKYRDSLGKLTYEFDDYGFRNHHDLDCISQSPYIITAGCSHTMGTGLYYDETYSQHLENITGIPVYNLGLAASSDEITMLNVIWMLTTFNPPKTIIFQQTGIDRFPIIDEYEFKGRIRFAGSWVDSWLPVFRDLEKFVEISDRFGYNKLKRIMIELMLKQICNKLEVKIIFFNLTDEVKTRQINYDVARDLIHFGTSTNFNIARLIKEKINL